MSRRSKLTKADRDKKAAKRERRAEGVDERQAARRVRESWARIPHAIKQKFQQAVQVYAWATRFPIVSQVVCESCGFAQPYRTDEDGSYPMSADGITLCFRQHLLGLPCNGEYAVTVERFSES